jgi:hypothetical protein
MLIYLAKPHTNTLSTALMQFHTGYLHFDHGNDSSNPPLQGRDHPDHNFYQDSAWTHLLVYFMVTCAIGITTQVLVLGGVGSMKLIVLLIPTPVFLSYLPIYSALSIWMFIMISILLEDIGYLPDNVFGPSMGTGRKDLIRFHKVVLFLSSLAGAFTLFVLNEVMPLVFLCGSATMYCLLSFSVHSTD